MTAPGPAIRTRGLSKRFGTVTALDALDLSVPRGVVFGLLGPNGAGKTTTIRLLTGLARPSAGGAEVAGIVVDAANGLELRRRIGVLDQDPRFYGWMTGRELLSFVGDLHGLQDRSRDDRVSETLERVGLTETADRRIGGYSGGMRQRLGIGQAIVGRPEVLILVKPVSRAAFLAAKLLAIGIVLAVGVAVAVAAALVYTVILFEVPDLGGWIVMAGAIWLSIAAYAAITFLGSVVTRSALGAAAIGFGGLIILALASAVPAFARWLPSGLTPVARAIGLGDAAAAPDAALTTLATVAIIAAAVVGSWVAFRRQELLRRA